MKKIASCMTAFALAGWAGIAQCALITVQDTVNFCAGKVSGGSCAGTYTFSLAFPNVQATSSGNARLELFGDFDLSIENVTYSGYIAAGQVILDNTVLASDEWDTSGFSDTGNQYQSIISMNWLSSLGWELGFVRGSTWTGESFTVSSDVGNLDAAYNNAAFARLTVTYESESVPEPASLALLGLGLAGIGYQRRKRVA